MRLGERVLRRIRKIAIAARYGTTDPDRESAPSPQVAPQPTPKSPSGVDYEGAWDTYAKTWRERFPDAQYLGDEWQGTEAGAAVNIDEYIELIERTFIAPYVEPEDHVLEIGVGGGRTALLLRDHAAHVTCADISADMLRATRERLGDHRMTYVKLDGRTLEGIPDASVDVLFCFDTLVHVEPRDIFNYLVRIPILMRGRRLVLLHHGNMLTDRGWDRFVREYQHNLMGRSGSAFSVMTDSIMQRFLDHLGYVVIVKDTTSVPRDCVWLVRAPEPNGPVKLLSTNANSEASARHVQTQP
jgi:SAM-dependent methyltransferase